MLEYLDILKDIMGLSEAVTFREFVSGKAYCNNKYLYEYWYKNQETISTNISELILDGSLGGGKSYFAAYYLAYRVYLLFLSGSPQLQLGLAEDTDVYVSYFSVSMTMAKKSGYNYIYDIYCLS